MNNESDKKVDASHPAWWSIAAGLVSVTLIWGFLIQPVKENVESVKKGLEEASKFAEEHDRRPGHVGTIEREAALDSNIRSVKERTDDNRKAIEELKGLVWQQHTETQHLLFELNTRISKLEGKKETKNETNGVSSRDVPQVRSAVPQNLPRD